jgi:cytochrome c biogenesis protein CcmG, thiol:disulfide interchange protein DsbE
MKIIVSSLSRFLPVFVLALSCSGLATPTVHAKGAPGTIAVIDSVLADTTELRDRVVYVDFWASWCAPCGQSFPWMNRLQAKYGAKGLRVITINLDKHASDGEDFIDQVRSTLDVIYDSTGSLARRFALDAIPSSFVYDRSGTLRSSHPGFVPADTVALDALVANLLSEKKGK